MAPFAAEHGRDLRDMHMLGTSGTVTTLAGVHLNLARYDRRRIDGIWMNDADIPAKAAVWPKFRRKRMTRQVRIDRLDCARVSKLSSLLPSSMTGARTAVPRRVSVSIARMQLPSDGPRSRRE